MKALLFNRWNKFLHTLNLYSCTQFCEINGEDYIDMETDEPLAKGDRILIYDGNKRWLEYVFNEGEQKHDGDQTYKMTCENSLMWDLSLKHIRYAGWDSADAEYALTELCKLHPAWSVGTVLSTPKKKLVYERESAYQALLETCGAFNCEIEKKIEMDKTGVFKREISLKEHIGERKNIRFDYKDGLFGVTKTINAEPVLTACYGYGSGIDDNELWCYITNDGATTLWGLSDGHGAIHHAEGEFTDNDIEDMEELRQATTDYLNAHSAPSITYETVIPYAAIEGAYLGDTIQVVDREFYPELRLDTRIGSLERDLMTNIVTNAVFGNVISYLPDALARSFDQEKVIIKQTTVIGELRSDLKSTQSSLASAQRDLTQAKTDLSKTQTDLSQAQRDLAQAKTDLSIAQRDAATAKQDADAAKQQANGLAATVQTQAGQISGLENRVSALESYYRSAQAAANYFSIVSTYHSLVTDGGSPMTSGTRSMLQSYRRNYEANPSSAIGNSTIDQWYNQLMAMPYSDEGGEEPSIGDVQQGEGPQIVEPTDEPSDASDETTE